MHRLACGRKKAACPINWSTPILRAGFALGAQLLGRLARLVGNPCVTVEVNPSEQWDSKELAPLTPNIPGWLLDVLSGGFDLILDTGALTIVLKKFGLRLRDVRLESLRPWAPNRGDGEVEYVWEKCRG